MISPKNQTPQTPEMKQIWISIKGSGVFSRNPAKGEKLCLWWICLIHLAGMFIWYLSTKYGRQSTQGYAQGSRLSADRCASHKQDGDARQTRGFIQVRPPRRRNTYVLRLICIAVCQWEMFFRGVPCPPYIVRGAGLQIWKLILVSYNCHMWPDKDSYSNRPGSCLVAKSVLIPCAGLRSG